MPTKDASRPPILIVASYFRRFAKLYDPEFTYVSSIRRTNPWSWGVVWTDWMSRNTVRCHATWRKITLLVVKVTLARRWEPKRLRLRLFTIPPAPAGRSASTWRPRPPGLTWSTTPSGDYVPWPSPA